MNESGSTKRMNVGGMLLIAATIAILIIAVFAVHLATQTDDSMMQSTQTETVPQPPACGGGPTECLPPTPQPAQGLDVRMCKQDRRIPSPGDPNAVEPSVDGFVRCLLDNRVSNPRYALPTSVIPIQSYDGQGHAGAFCTVQPDSTLTEIRPDGLGYVLAFYTIPVNVDAPPNACTNGVVGFLDETMFH